MIVWGRREERRRGEEEKRRVVWCSQKVKVQPGLAVAHQTMLRHHYKFPVAHKHSLRHGYVG